jgi:hypothetical protein
MCVLKQLAVLTAWTNGIVVTEHHSPLLETKASANETRQMQTDDNKRHDSIRGHAIAANVLAKWIQTAELHTAHASGTNTTLHTELSAMLNFLAEMLHSA